MRPSPLPQINRHSKIEHEWNEATKAKDGAFFEKHLSGDFTDVSEDGEFMSGPAAYVDVIMKMPKGCRIHID
jgi:hypothetical protein